MPEAKKNKKKEFWVTPKMNKIGLSQTEAGANPAFSERFNQTTFPTGTTQFAQS